MCGILAIWNASGVSQAAAEKSLSLLKHRGPDADQLMRLTDGRLCFGHTRLKVIDTSDSANQPMTSSCGRYTLVFNGEIVNYREVKHSIPAGWVWQTLSDSEVLLAAWSHWGEACLHRFVGMFAFCLYDRLTNTVTLVRDRFGIKPLYFCRSSNSWGVASEIPPLLSLMQSVKSNNSTIKTYLESGLYDHTDATFFSGVEKVKPGNLIRIDLGEPRWQEHQWYELRKNFIDLAGWSKADLLTRTEELLTTAVQSHLVADVSVGLNVSGGVDSSLLVELGAGVDSDSARHLFTQDYEGYSELPWVREVTGSCPLHISELSAFDIEQLLMTTVKSQAEPFGGVTVCGYNSLYKQARMHDVTVLLDGNGLDEIFLGYKRYHIDLLRTERMSPDAQVKLDDYRSFWQEEPALADKGTAIDGSYGLCPGAISKKLAEEEVLQLPSLAESADPVRRVALEDLLYSKIPRGLRFNDRVSMAHSRELRVPFLDHRLVEFGCSIPTERLINASGTKSVLRNILEKKGKARIARAKKRSVQSPQREWLAHEWKAMVEAIIGSDSFADRNWIDPDFAKKQYLAYCNGENANSFYIWQWLNLELWARTYLD